MEPTDLSAQRIVMRERDRLKRQRRAVRCRQQLDQAESERFTKSHDFMAKQARLEVMRDTLAALETAIPIMLTLDSADLNPDVDDQERDALWEGFLDPKAMLVRSLMQKTISLTKEAQKLQSSRNQLKRLLREHQVASLVLAGMVAEKDPVAEWKEDVKRWRALVRKHYKPWSMEECEDEMGSAMKVVESFQWRTDTRSTGGSFMGWRDSRRFDPERGTFQFELRKTFRGYDMMKQVKIGWDTFTDTQVFYNVIIGPRAHVVDGVAIGERVRAMHEVLQELDDNIKIVRNIEWYPDIAVNAHVVSLSFLLETERGSIQCLRSICCPELMKVIDEPTDVWPSNLIWFVYERLDGDEPTHEMRIGGSLIGSDVNYAGQWMFEVLGSVLRGESLLTRRQLIAFDGGESRLTTDFKGKQMEHSTSM